MIETQEERLARLNAEAREIWKGTDATILLGDGDDECAVCVALDPEGEWSQVLMVDVDDRVVALNAAEAALRVLRGQQTVRPLWHPISDEALDRFDDGWTPVMVRNLVARYREAKSLVHEHRDMLDQLDGLRTRLDELIARGRERNTEKVEINEQNRRSVDADGFYCGLEYACMLFTKAKP